MPQTSGRVIARQAAEAFGQACWKLPDVQVPQAPRPVDAHGPQALPQQNQDTSPVTAAMIGPPFGG
ncbi:hypothetical protein GCM10027615_01460 [Plantactinospora veratri]